MAEVNGNGTKLKEAYSKYLQSTKNIIDSLQVDFNGYAVSQESAKLLRLGQQCMDRMADLLKNLNKYTSVRYEEKSPVTSPIQPYRSLDGLGVCGPSTENNDQRSAPTRMDYRTTVKADNIISQTESRRKKSLNSKELSPLEEAQKKNKMLLTAYRARMAGTAVNKGQAATLSMALQRRLAENMAVAKAREQALLRKQQERHKRLQEEAARSLQSTIGMSQDELDRRQLYSKVLQYEQNSKQLLSWRERLKSHPDNTQLSETVLEFVFSQQNHPLTQILLKYQYAAYNKLYPLIQQYMENQVSRTNNQADDRTRSCGDSAELRYSINNNISADDTNSTDLNLRTESPTCVENETPSSPMSLCSTTSRSISTDSKSITSHNDNSIINKPVKDSNNTSDTETFVMLSPHDSKSLDPVDVEGLEKDALQRHLVNIVEDVHMFLEKIRTMVVVAYEDFDTVEGRDVCYSCIEERFFKPVWPYIIALYRIVYKDKEDSLRSVMKDYSDCTPSDMGVSDKYCLTEPVPTPYSHPYEPCAKQLMSVVECTSPLTKLGCIVKASRMICKCVEEHFTNLETTHTANLGADDLLPILSYSVIKSKRAELLAEAHALEEFIYEGYLMGEEGYCLTSLQTALCYIMTLEATNAEQ